MTHSRQTQNTPAPRLTQGSQHILPCCQPDTRQTRHNANCAHETCSNPASLQGCMYRSTAKQVIEQITIPVHVRGQTQSSTWQHGSCGVQPATEWFQDIPTSSAMPTQPPDNQPMQQMVPETTGSCHNSRMLNTRCGRCRVTAGQPAWLGRALLQLQVQMQVELQVQMQVQLQLRYPR